MKTCSQCKFAYFQDEGYSNYTVEGTVFRCMKRLHPEDGFDRWYGEDQRLQFAEQCPGFESGDAVSLDVERDDVDRLTPEQKSLLAAYNTAV